VAAGRGEVVVWARSPESEQRAREHIGDEARHTTRLATLGTCSFVVEAVVEDLAVKGDLLREIGAVVGDDALIGSTTSSLSVARLAEASGRPDRFVGLHVFNPVERMELVELAFPDVATGETRERARRLCESLGKVPVEVPDAPGFVVNRLLFPYLFAAVRLLERHDVDPEAIDTCMRLGAAHRMGPLQVLDLVGLDVAMAIGAELDEDVPDRLRELVDAGHLGRKAGRGFYEY
jgi:3-hydroxyacyl-CoA dehydrogenase